MFKILLLVFPVLMNLHAVSQQDHFLYLQSEDRQPFYAKLSGQVHSSSENGYLIIPKLVDGTYQLDIGFAKSVFPEQHFPLLVNKKDLGFQIKNLGDKGWALYNFRNSELLASSNVIGQKGEDYSGVKKTDIFSEMLANVVNDSAILYSAAKPTPPPKPVIKDTKPDTMSTIVVAKAPEKEALIATFPPVNQDQVKTSLKKDSVKITIDTATSILAKADPPEKEVPVLVKAMEEPKTPSPIPSVTATTAIAEAPTSATKEKPFIIRINESTSATGYEAMFLEQYVLTTDTIRISIPFQENEMVAKSVPEPVKHDAPIQSQPQSQPSVTTNETVVVPPIVKPETPKPKNSVLQVLNSDCKNFATEYDVDKLRVKIMTEYAIEDKMVAAKKVFKTKCFTVKQIRALSELFTSDETRYQFFDAAYPFVSDSAEFQTLESLIISDYYKNRFKAMVHK